LFIVFLESFLKIHFMAMAAFSCSRGLLARPRRIVALLPNRTSQDETILKAAALGWLAVLRDAFQHFKSGAARFTAMTAICDTICCCFARAQAQSRSWHSFA
jgi:hypothetical protein